MSLLPIVLIGAGGHAVSCVDVIEQSNKYAIVGLIGEPSEVGTSVLGYRVAGTDSELPALATVHHNALIAIGHIKSPDLRMALFDRLISLGWHLPVIISPRAYVSPHAQVGAGTIVMHDVIVNAGASIGRNCILNSASLIEHDVKIADHCHIATSAVINGAVTIGAGTFIGSQSSVRQGIRIGERCLIGMGQRVLKDCASGSTLPVDVLRK